MSDRDAMIRDLEEARAEVFRLVDRIEAGTAHRVVCNANREEPIGGDGCICNPRRSEMAALHARNQELEARVAGWRADYDEAISLLSVVMEQRASLAQRLARFEALAREAVEANDRLLSEDRAVRLIGATNTLAVILSLCELARQHVPTPEIDIGSSR